MDDINVLFMGIYVIVSIIIFSKYPSTAMILAWAVLTLFSFLSLIGAVGDGIVFLVFILIIPIFTVTALITHW